MGSKERFKLIPAVHLFLVRGQEILLSRRFNTGWEDGNYSVPCGHVEENETVTAALIREVHEEIGSIISPADLRFVHVMHRNGGAENTRVDFFFAAERWGGEPRNMEPRKCDDLKWCPLDALPENTIPYIRSALDHYRRGVFYSEFGWQ